MWALQKKNIGEKMLHFLPGTKKKHYRGFFPTGMQASLVTDEKGQCLQEKEKQGAAEKWRVYPSSLAAGVMCSLARSLCVSYLYNDFMVDENEYAQKNGHTLCGLAGERRLAHPTRADKANSGGRQLASHRGDATDKPEEEPHNQGAEDGMRYKPSKSPAHITWEKGTLGCSLHAHWTEAQLHTPVPWLATKQHCRQTKRVNHKAAKKKWESKRVSVLASNAG